MRLRANGFEVETAANGREALVKLAAAQPQLLITDLRMEEMDGIVSPKL